MQLIESLASNKEVIKEFQEKGLISEDLSRADLEVIKRLIISGVEGILMNLFIRKNIATSGIVWRQ